ncbi:MAG: SAM-dependent methyltransferase, partial [Chloroflexi bacterium]|nr:SAM-dependent methyltransferase [Chloroflexota bacterium]
GIWWRGKYIFGNIPFVNWLPTRLRNRLVPHARVYGYHGFEDIVDKQLFEIVEHTYVFPGFDNIFARSRLIAGLLRKLCYSLEATYFKRLGISHLLVLRRIDRKDAL